MHRLTLLLSLAAAPTLVAQRAGSQAPFDLPLYSGPAPGASRSATAEIRSIADGDARIALVTHVQVPDVRVYLPPRAKATGAAIVIYPGGGYSVLAIDHEGYQLATWLNSIGVAAIVCKYRVSATEGAAYRFPVPLLDARQAIRLTRAHAAEWRIDPARVGVMGFSAGGHLASMTVTMADEAVPGEDAAVFATMQHRPDFGVLVYPVISMHEPWGHRGSSDNLLGADATQERRQHFSTDQRVTDRTPPTFLVATEDDDAVPAQNSIAFYQAMMAHKVPGELHIWAQGGHGFGILAGGAPVALEWTATLANWMRARGVLARK